MFSYIRRPVAVTLFAGVGATTTTTGARQALAEKKEPEPWKYLAVYLTPESHKNLQAQLDKLEMGTTHTPARRVIVRSRMSGQDEYIYQPLYGERAAFRLKGVVKSEDAGLLVGLGRLSTIAGELREEDFEASITLYPKDTALSSAEERSAMDLPTRLARADVVRGKQYWKGRISPQSVLGRGYSAERASFTSVGYADQIVVDGYICSNEHVDEQGGCTFDRGSLSENDEPPPPTPTAVASKEAGAPANSKAKENASKETNAKESRECPVCQFMKGGPCKEQFLVWDACVQNMSEDDDLSVCFPPTLKMMECMRQYEYYDIMTANSESKMAAAKGETK